MLTKLFTDAIKSYEEKGCLRVDEYNESAGKMSLALLYNPAIQTATDKKKTGGQAVCVCQVNITIQDNHPVDGNYSFPFYGTDTTWNKDASDREIKRFRKFKNHLGQTGILNLIIGYPPAGYVVSNPYSGMPYYCSEAEALRLMLAYFWGMTIDRFSPKKDEKSKVNAFNGRYGHSLERLVIDDTVFYALYGESMLTAVGRRMNELLKVMPGDVITADILKEKEWDGTPIKSDIVLYATTYDIWDNVVSCRSLRVSVKGPQAATASQSISILGVGDHSRCGFAEVASVGFGKKVTDLIYALNTTFVSDAELARAARAHRGPKAKGKFQSLDTIESDFRWSHADADLVRQAIYTNYLPLIRLALLGSGNPYSKNPASPVDVVVEFCLQTGHGCCLTRDQVEAGLAKMNLDDFKRCFPISNTSSNTMRIMMNSDEFMKVLKRR